MRQARRTPRPPRAGHAEPGACPRRSRYAVRSDCTTPSGAVPVVLLDAACDERPEPTAALTYVQPERARINVEFVLCERLALPKTCADARVGREEDPKLLVDEKFCRGRTTKRSPRSKRLSKIETSRRRDVLPRRSTRSSRRERSLSDGVCASNGSLHGKRVCISSRSANTRSSPPGHSSRPRRTRAASAPANKRTAVRRRRIGRASAASAESTSSAGSAPMTSG